MHRERAVERAGAGGRAGGRAGRVLGSAEAPADEAEVMSRSMVLLTVTSQARLLGPASTNKNPPATAEAAQFWMTLSSTRSTEE